MRTYAKKPKATQQTMSAKSTKPGRAHFGQSRDVNSTLHLQHTIGNHAVQRLLRTSHEELEAGSATIASSRSGHDFSQVPLHPQPQNKIQPKLMVSSPADIYEQEAARVADQVMRMPEPHLKHSCACGGGCPKCQVEQQGQENQFVQRRHISANDARETEAPRIVNKVVNSLDQPLDSATTAFFESRFRHDFSQVRVHTDTRAAESARALNARAFTVDRDIVFRAGQYAIGTSGTRRLLAHELTHVLQQTPRIGVTPRSIHHGQHHSTLTVQRQPYTSTPAQTQRQPEVIQDTPSEQRRWRIRVDRAVRAFFRLRGPGLTSSRVGFVDEAQFASRFPAASIPEKLLDIFLAASFNSKPYQILDHNHQLLSSFAQLRAFIQQGITQGFFEGQTREIEVRTGRRFPAFRVTPGQLIAENIAGITDVSGRRSSRRILVQAPTYVHTLVHEACHFYIHSRFRDMAAARPDRDDYLFGARVLKTLEEGFAEYFARQVMEANEADFGPLSDNAYQAEVNNAIRLARTIGEREVRQAYFRGDERQIRRVGQAIDQYKELERLM